MNNDVIHIGFPDYRSLADGTAYGSFSAFRTRYSALIDDYYGILKNRDEKCGLSPDVYKRKPSFTGDSDWENTPDDRNGGILYIPRGIQHSQPFYVTVAGTQRMLIVLEENSQAKLFVDFLPEEDTSRLCEIFLGKGATLEITELRDSGPHTVENEVLVRQDEESRFINFNVNCGGKTFNRHKVTLAGRHTESHLYGTAVLNGTDELKNHTAVEHDEPECESFEHYKTVANGNASSEFFGRIYVAPDAQQIAAYQQNNNILLSDTADIRTKPQLEIYADDVKCSHGATIGQLDDEAMYYMRQRGISPVNARKLQIRGFVSDVVERISDAGIREIILKRLDTGINRL